MFDLIFDINFFTIQEKQQHHERVASYQQARDDEDSKDSPIIQSVKVNIFIKMGILTSLR